jgi:hypothetical protein
MKNASKHTNAIIIEMAKHLVVGKNEDLDGDGIVDR